jgi:hypothetical protein
MVVMMVVVTVVMMVMMLGDKLVVSMVALWVD